MSAKENIQGRLSKAIWAFDLKGILAALDEGADVNYLNEEDDETVFTKLEFASDLNFDYSCFKNETEEKALELLELKKIGIMKHLLARGADINLYAKNGRSTTALYTAVCRAEIEMVRFLLENGADPSLNFFPDESPPEEISAVLVMARTDEFLDSYGHAGKLRIIIGMLEAKEATGFKSENSK